MSLKKGAAIAMVLCLSLVLLSGCGAGKEHGLDAKNPTVITIWHYYNGVQQDTFDRMLVEFNETVGLEKGIVVEARSKNSINDLAEAALAALRQNEDEAENERMEVAPDMFTAYAETAYVADQMGAVVDLSKYFTAKELEEYIPGYLEEGSLDEKGGLKIFPTAKSTEMVMLNVTDWTPFAEATGVTTDDLTTWERLAETAEKYYEYTDALTPDIPNDGKAFFGRDSVANYMIIGARQLGLVFVSTESGEAVLNEDKDVIRRLWDNYYAPYVKGYYAANARFRSDDIMLGEIIAMACSSTGATYFPATVTLNDEYSYPIEGIVLPVPNFEGAEPYIVQQGAGMVVVKSEEKREYACSVFLKWFTEKERNITFSALSGYLPVKKDANNFEAIAASYQEKGDQANTIMLNSIDVAVSEINHFTSYAAKPFAKSAETRAFLESYIQTTAQTAHAEAVARIEAGEDRAAVMAEYVSDEAFESWYEGFISGLRAASEL